MDEARRMDLADRFLNTKATRCAHHSSFIIMIMIMIMIMNHYDYDHDYDYV